MVRVKAKSGFSPLEEAVLEVGSWGEAGEGSEVSLDHGVWVPVGPSGRDIQDGRAMLEAALGESFIAGRWGKEAPAEMRQGPGKQLKKLLNCLFLFYCGENA